MEQIIKEIKEKLNKESQKAVKKDWTINISIREKKFTQYCGDGKQRVRWLTDCAIFKYENLYDNRINLGIAYGLKNEKGELCNLDSLICESMENGSNVMVLFKDDYEQELEERKNNIKYNLNNEDFNNYPETKGIMGDNNSDGEEEGMPMGDDEEEGEDIGEMYLNNSDEDEAKN